MTIGPSEVRATSGQHLGGHYFAYINLFLLLLVVGTAVIQNHRRRVSHFGMNP
jgi:hypothetical protein